MPRRIAAVLLLGVGLAAAACRPDTVRLGFDPDPAATYRYRYEIDASITRQVEGEPPRTTTVHLTIESTETVLDATEDGTRLEVTLTSPGSPPSTAVVLVDRAGSLQAIQEVDGLPADAVGLPVGALLASTSVEPPAHPLTIGEEWDIGEGSLHGDGRLDRLGVLDGEPAAVVESTLVDVLAETVERGGSEVALDGDLRSTTTTAFDLGDGSIRRSHTRSDGTVDVLVAPPAEVVATAVEAQVTYELEVRTTRLA